MDKFNNSNSSLASHKFYNQNNDVRILELQQRLKIEQISTSTIEMTPGSPTAPLIAVKVINEEPGPPTVSSDAVQVVVEEQVEEKVIIEEQVVEEIPDSQIVLFDTVYQSNENFEIEKPTTIIENNKPVLDQIKINNLIKLKKW